MQDGAVWRGHRWHASRIELRLLTQNLLVSSSTRTTPIVVCAQSLSCSLYALTSEAARSRIPFRC
ncbi:MAG: hypothetical protein AVDCRST_MAG93-2761 [uncultured Chloroflexia bacterium]|uniref:Uncharacterized protein n=1 Tax=uncultured Chloroflexia bacterium TaxID=1672391 RepID=A0A6J4JAG9_9CHLR|nr:MAG: hypothetical protein AVDCRST_MAG93-2761 [uncultured Chloroflexia bacterium]